MATAPNPVFGPFGLLFSELDGKEYIVIHPQAYTELGRLLSGVSSMEFSVPGKPGLDDYGNYPNFYAAVDNHQQHRFAEWVDSYQDPNHNGVNVTGSDKDRLAFIMECKLNQNWYIDSLLTASKGSQRLIFVKETVITEPAGQMEVKRYTHLPSHDCLSAYLHRRRYKLREKHNRRISAQSRKNR